MDERKGSPNRKPDPIPDPPINEIFRLRISGTCEGQMTVNTMTWRGFNILPGNATRAQVDAFFAEITAPAGVMSLYCDAVSIDWQGVEAIIDLPTNNKFMPVPYGIANQVGKGPAGHCPTTVAVVVHKRSTFKGRHGRGRVMMPAVPLSWVIGSTLDPLKQVAYLAFSNVFGNALNNGTNQWNPGVLGIDKRTNPTNPASWPFTWVDTVEGTFNPVLGNVRRRRPGRGK